jgi:PAS domain S-box-containing protein
MTPDTDLLLEKSRIMGDPVAQPPLTETGTTPPDAARLQDLALSQAIVANALDCILAVDAEGRLVEFNPAAERTLGWRREEVLGRRVDGLIVADGFHLYEEERVGRRVEVSALRRDGTPFPAELSIIRFDVGGVPFHAATLHDITDRKQAERALLEAKTQAEDALRVKRAFLGNMSHELRTPLNAIIGFSEILRNQMLGPLGEPKYAEFAVDIHESGRLLLGIINDVLDMARIEAGQMQLWRESIDISAVVRSSLQMVRDRAAKAEVTLIDETGPLPVGLLADRLAMMKILLNLLSNAVKFTPPGGSARVAVTTEPSGTVVLHVADTGIGMPPDVLEHVFEPFHQADMGLNRTHKGSGLGLPITRALVELHGGSIALTSQPGRGTTATVRFPPAVEP